MFLFELMIWNHIFTVLKSPGPILLELGPFIFRWYGLLIAISVLIGLKISNEIAIRKGLKHGLINDLLPTLIISSLIGARLYYVAFQWQSYSGINFWDQIQFFGFSINLPRFIEVWNGGIAIHGALIAGTICVMFFCRLHNQSFWAVLDVILPSVALGQAIGRWGNFFNNEAFGLPTNLPWKLFIPYVYRPMVFSKFSYFHPTFLYESIWNLAVFFLLLYLLKLSLQNSLKLPSGALSCMYLILYSIGRLWIEGLRIDPLCVGASAPFCEGGFRIAQLISIILICLGSLGIYWIYQKKRKMPEIRSFTQKRI